MLLPLLLFLEATLEFPELVTEDLDLVGIGEVDRNFFLVVG